MKIALVMGVVAIALKLTLFKAEVEHGVAARIVMFSHLMLIMIGTFFGVRAVDPGASDSDTKIQLKSGMRVAGLYALIVCAFLVVYYEFINPNYFQSLIESKMEAVSNYKLTHPEVDIENERKTAELFLSTKFQVTITLFGLVISGVIYSLLITFFLKKLSKFQSR